MTIQCSFEESPTRVAEWLRSRHRTSDGLLIDYRSADEHAICRIDGAERVGELGASRDEPIVVHCHRGVRSSRVTHWLRERGFPLEQSMRGGIDAWSTDVDPAVPRY